MLNQTETNKNRIQIANSLGAKNFNEKKGKLEGLKR